MTTENTQVGADSTLPAPDGSSLSFTSDELLMMVQALRLLESVQRIVAILPQRGPHAAVLDPLKLSNAITRELLFRQEGWSILGRFVTAKLRGKIGLRQGWVISVDPPRIRTPSGIEHDCKDQPTIVVNPPTRD